MVPISWILRLLPVTDNRLFPLACRGRPRSSCAPSGRGCRNWGTLPRQRPGEGDAHRIMIGVVIVAHGGLAKEFRAALEHVVGPQEGLESLPIGPDDDVEARRMELIDAVRRVDTGDGVIVLTDMYGGTHSNLAM